MQSQRCLPREEEVLQLQISVTSDTVPDVGQPCRTRNLRFEALETRECPCPSAAPVNDRSGNAEGSAHQIAQLRTNAFAVVEIGHLEKGQSTTAPTHKCP